MYLSDLSRSPGQFPYLSMKVNKRGLIVLGVAPLCLAGWAILLGSHDQSVRLVSRRAHPTCSHLLATIRRCDVKHIDPDDDIFCVCRYGAIFLTIGGAFVPGPTLPAWTSGNVVASLTFGSCYRSGSIEILIVRLV
jgi:hypothetical protein